jgi:prefoldin subunit 5
MALKDYPEIQAAFAKLMAEKQAIASQVAPLRAEYNALQVEIEALMAKQRAVGAQIKSIERPALVEIDAKLSVMARATGGISLNG